MSGFSIGFETVARLATTSIGLMLVAKWTLLLALAWLTHVALAGRNPRWRVALWRGAILGVGLVAALALIPPIVHVPVVPTLRPVLMEPHEPFAMPPGFEPAPPPAAFAAAAPSGMERRAADGSLARSALGAEVGAASAPAGSWPLSALGLARSWAPSIWLAGMLILTARLILGGLALARLVRRSSDATDDIARECRAIAVRLGCTRAVRVVRSADVASPCLAGLVRPVLLLPDGDDHQPDDLRAILAHELAHACHHDLAWNLASHLASIVLWFHPMAWRMRSAHASACDAVSDAVAADYLGDVTSYGRTLARLAIGASSPAPAHVLAMARTSDVRRRLDALNRQVFRTPLSWKFIMPALLVGGVILTLIGGFGFTRAEPADDPPAPQNTGKLTLHAVATATGRPIEGVSIEYLARFADREDQKGIVATRQEGLATIDYPPDARIGYFHITARKAGLIPISFNWNDRRAPVELPPSKELRLERGTTVGGLVTDEAGKPIPGTRVEVIVPPTGSEDPHRGFSMAATETDARGRWRLDVAPKDLKGVEVNVTHPHYRRNTGTASRNFDGAIVLAKGLTVTGRAVDAGGRPVKGAQAVLARDVFTTDLPTRTTDERGEFILEGCEPGLTFVTMQMDGFAPQFQEIQVGLQQAAPVVFRLSEPAGILRARVVDLEGKPVAGAYFAADTWRGRRLLRFYARTDRDGRIEWRGAPRDAVLYDAGRSGYMSSRHVPLVASGQEHVIALKPELVITGRVVDAETGQPLPRFRLVQGRKYSWSKETRWEENEAMEVTEGRYTARFSEPCEAFYVRVEALGYEPAESRAFRSTDGTRRFDFAVRRGEVLSGVVVRLDGKPDPGAEVVLATKTRSWLMEAGRFDRRANLPRTRTDAGGQFAFSPPKGEFLIVAASDAGYAEATPKELAESGKLVLRSWGRIEGEVRIGGRPAVGQEVTYLPGPFPRGGRTYEFSYGYHVKTDGQGRFAFDRVVPGPGTAWREVAGPAGRGGISALGWRTDVEVKPGQTTKVRVGGEGRAVIGRVVLDGQPESPVDWTRNEPVELFDRRGGRQFASDLDRDGRFRIEDVPPGVYRLRAPVNGPPKPGSLQPGAMIGAAAEEILVPEGPAHQPSVVGSIKAKVFETLKAGDPAPDFDVERLAGKGKGDRLKLGDERGKLVLIDFWAAERGPDPADMADLKEIWKTFGGDPRFRLISLSCDETPEAARRAIRENGLIWTHGFAGGPGSSVIMNYKLRGIPAAFLIGPDGRILAKGLRGAELKEAVAKALKDDGLDAGRRPPP